uniref:Uncharacterized protein n=1 Tax=Arundo donax TaxID=35708 RepID=A0A0A9E8P3_ARUDO
MAANVCGFHHLIVNSTIPGKRCIRTLTSLSNELNTKLQRHTINAQASGPSANEKQTMKSFSSFG